MRSVLLLLLTFVLNTVAAQKCLWLAASDCGVLMNARHLCVDARGNVYVGGEYEGEALFHSANSTDTSIDKYCSSGWHKTFIARYNPQGKITMVVQFKTTGSNSTLTYGEGMHVLPNGDLVVFVNGGGEYVNPKGEHTKAGNNGRGSNLYCIDSLGRLKWSVLTTLDHCSELEISPNGTIYAYGHNGNYGSDKALLKYSANGVLVNSLVMKGPGINTMCFKGAKLYALISNGGYGNFLLPTEASNAFDMPKDHMGLFEMDTATLSATQLFTTAMPVSNGYNGKGLVNFRSCINCTSAELYVDLVLNVDFTTTFLSKEFQRSQGNMHFVRMDEKGELFASNAFRSGYDNYSFIPAPGGGLYFTVGVWGRIFHWGNDSLQWNELPNYLEEQVLMRLDAHYNKVWWKTAGASASNYHSTKLTTGPGGELYIYSDLLQPEFIFERQVEMPWRCVSFIAKLKE